MKRKLYYSALFFFFFLVFDRGAALFFRDFNYSLYGSPGMKKDSFGKLRLIKKDFYNTMVFGSSRTLQSIHPEYLYHYLGLRAYSEAKMDRYPEYFYRFYLKFRDSIGVPDYLFYGTDYFMFKRMTGREALFKLTKNVNMQRKINFRKQTNKNSPVFSAVSLSFRIKKKIDKTMDEWLEVIAVKSDRTDQSKSRVPGISPFLGKKKSIRPRLTIRPGSWEKFSYVDSSNGEGRFLRLLFDELEKDNVTVFLVGIPCYTGTNESNFEQDLFINDLKDIIRGRKNFHLLDYNRPDTFDLGNPLYFNDGGYGFENSHLSYDGAIPFNRMLARDAGKIAGIRFAEGN